MQSYTKSNSSSLYSSPATQSTTKLVLSTDEVDCGRAAKDARPCSVDSTCAKLSQYLDRSALCHSDSMKSLDLESSITNDKVRADKALFALQRLQIRIN